MFRYVQQLRIVKVFLRNCGTWYSLPNVVVNWLGLVPEASCSKLIWKIGPPDTVGYYPYPGSGA